MSELLAARLVREEESAITPALGCHCQHVAGIAQVCAQDLLKPQTTRLHFLKSLTCATTECRARQAARPSKQAKTADDGASFCSTKTTSHAETKFRSLAGEGNHLTPAQIVAVRSRSCEILHSRTSGEKGTPEEFGKDGLYVCAIGDYVVMPGAAWVPFVCARTFTSFISTTSFAT